MKKFNDSLKGLLDDKEKLAAFVEDAYVESMRIQEKNRTFFHSLRFSQIMSYLTFETKKNGPISDNGYKDFLFKDVTNKEFIQLFECLFDPEISGLTSESIDDDFSQNLITYNNLIFSEIHGQGTAFFVQAVNENKGDLNE